MSQVSREVGPNLNTMMITSVQPGIIDQLAEASPNTLFVSEQEPQNIMENWEEVPPNTLLEIAPD